MMVTKTTTYEKRRMSSVPTAFNVAKMNSKCLTKVSEQERESCEENSQKK
jgi:hypothetical protein